MKLTLLGILLMSVTGKNLRKVLKSPRETLQLYKDFKDTQRMHFLPEEERERFRIFRTAAERVARLNEDQIEEAEYELNAFSLMTDAEKHEWLGVNASQAEASQEATPPRVERRIEKRTAIPDSKNWIDEGMVTTSTDQARCGSCWAFAAIGSLEGGYALSTGVLRKFSEQELLDCTYDHRIYNFTYEGRYWEGFVQDGCNGGWYHWSFQYVQDHGRLATAEEYPYHAHDCTCEGSKKKNGLVAARVFDFSKVRPQTEEAIIEALSVQVLSVAFTVTDNFYPYKRGIWKDEGCKTVKHSPNHAVTLVAYTPTYVLSKNSWGAHWGDQGYIRFKRNHDHCYLWKYGARAFFEPTGVIDAKPADPESTFNATLTDPHPDCEQFENIRNDCDLDTCDEEEKEGQYWVDCKSTCNNCGHKGPYTGGCPEGTQLCDGVCKHVHMC